MVTSTRQSISFLPVGNGDAVLVSIGDDFNLLVDVKITQAARDPDDSSVYDVYGHLMRELPKDKRGRPYLSAFVNTHPDQDHLHGFATYFHTGDPSAYVKKPDEPKIFVNELWFAPRVFNEYHRDLCDDARAFKKEARRRIELFSQAKGTQLAGNRIRVLGASESEHVEDLKDVQTFPGEVLSHFDGVDRDDISIFLHAPFKGDTDDEVCERNDASVVMQLRFKRGTDPLACRILLGGDAGATIWEKIILKSADETLKWDLLLAPHHCSWTFFSDGPSDAEEADAAIMDFLRDHHLQGARVVASSKPIKNDDDNPPHFVAAKRYREAVGKMALLCTGEHPSEKSPRPLVFDVSEKGPILRTASPGTTSGASLAETYKPVLTPKTYG